VSWVLTLRSLLMCPPMHALFHFFRNPVCQKWDEKSKYHLLLIKIAP
jgi:hypothetical protein